MPSVRGCSGEAAGPAAACELTSTNRPGGRRCAASASSSAAVGATLPRWNSASVRRRVTPATWKTASTPSNAASCANPAGSS
jgi:hypothetical protein